MPAKPTLYRRRLGPEPPLRAHERCRLQPWSLHDWCDNEWTGRRTCRRCRCFYMRRLVGPCRYCGYPVWRGEWGSDCYRRKAHRMCANLGRDRNWRRPKGVPGPMSVTS